MTDVAERLERAREARAQYAGMSPEEKCVFAGKLIERTTFARVYDPGNVDYLLTCRICKQMPSERPVDPLGNPLCGGHAGGVCKPRNAVAREDQIAPWRRDPATKIRTWTAMGGRGAGKSFIATSDLLPEALMRAEMRIGALGPDFGVSVRVGMKGPAGFETRVRAFDPELVWKYDEVRQILYLANGTRIFALTTENPKSIEGPEYHAYWCDELAELRGQGGDNCIWRKRAEPGVRLVGDKGEPIRKIMTGTPEATPLIRDLYESTKKYPKSYAWTTLATKDNIANLDEEAVRQKYEEATDENGQLNRYGKAKLEGHLILESPNALLNAAELAAINVVPSDDRHRTPEQMDKTILAVDANHSEDKKSDECGLIIMGRRQRADDARIVHVFGDASIPGGPKKWGDRIIEVLIAFPEIDELVVEDDKSLVLDVVERVLRDELQKIGRPIKITPMPHRNRSKKKRADPVAVEYQLKHVLHDLDPRAAKLGWVLDELEWQWTSWNPKEDTKSPDRVDANVYGVTSLVIAGRAPDSFHRPGQ